MSDSLQPHGLPGFSLHHHLPDIPQLCPLSQWCYPTISSSVVPFSSCLQSSPASGSFPMSRLFTSHGQSIGTAASALVLPVNIQAWFPLGLTGLISFSPRDSQGSSLPPQFTSINAVSNPPLLHCQTDFLPLSHEGSLYIHIYIYIISFCVVPILVKAVTDFIFLGFKTVVDSDHSHKIKK